MSSPMTPTEQDKELLENSFGEWLENHGVELIGNNPSHLGTWQAMVDMNELKLAIMQLSISDRKRLALEARLDEIGLMQHQARVNLKTSNAVAEWGDIRIAQLKAQQEEV